MKIFLFLLSAMTVSLLWITCTIPISGTSSGPTPSDTLTEINKASVMDFFTTAFVNKEVKNAFYKYVGEKYIHHNPGVGNGRELPIQYLNEWLKENPEASCRIKRVIAEHDLVVIHSHWKDAPDKAGRGGYFQGGAGKDCGALGCAAGRA
jgi:predicted SnoaL-like aldol condensation-catalyzing enzyme